ncbi:hypothetical protein F4820DRAFT_298987 [Hypoxylon rubiginosum]|uniref:Uncharacterized protein n=1 Tax=Hypoxylon rubiginosum TaxID=110542 RepID=A0ACB9Z2K4_9PEZI|nr:hypothetical protein F4820DRAFT_298987 [Hypoxylon rubiginosum]
MRPHLPNLGQSKPKAQPELRARVKEEDSFLKIKKRSYEHLQSREYTDEKSVPGRRWDYMGLRIALFFPDQQSEVENIIRESFEEIPEDRKMRGWFQPYRTAIRKGSGSMLKVITGLSFNPQGLKFG